MIGRQDDTTPLTEKALLSVIQALMMDDDGGFIPCGTPERRHLVHPNPVVFTIGGVAHVMCQECGHPVRWQG